MRDLHILPLPKVLERRDNLVDLREFHLEGKDLSERLRNLYLRDLPLAPDRGEKPFDLIKDDALGEEAYSIRISPENIRVAASSERGFFYALQTLKQLRDGNRLHEADIEDYPDLGMRGLQINFNGLRRMGLQEARAFLESAAGLKLNTILLEYGDRFPYAGYPLIPADSALTLEEIGELTALADDLFLEIMPLQQCLGHLGYVIRHKEYAGSSESGASDGEQLCPLSPDSFRFFTGLASEMLAAHPGIRYLHIGGDETRQLGDCPRCAGAAASIGKSGLYLDYVNSVCRWVMEQGVTPVLWDDMLCRYPETLDGLDKSAVIMYWDYWTTTARSPITVARPAGKGIVCDPSWLEDASGLSDVERDVLQAYARPLDMKEEAVASFADNFRNYLGEDFPRYATSFPYLGYYMDKGHRVIGGPTALGNGADRALELPNFARYAANIKEFSRRCLEEKAEGIITTLWYNYPLEVVYAGLVNTGCHTWNAS